MALLSGCGSKIPDLSPEHMEKITDYSAALLYKYDSSTPSRLLPEGSVVTLTYVDPNSDGAVAAEVVPDTEKTPEIEVNSEPENSSEDVTVTDAVTGEVTSTPAHSEGFTDFLAGTGLSVMYSGNYEVADSYPEGEAANPYFTVDASSGNKLLVLHFTITNTSGSEMSVSLGSLNLRYRVSINGGKNKFVMTTLLDNDILSYSGTLAADESVDIVAIAEITQEEASNIQTIDFTIRGDEFSTSMSLQ
ncbi:MAG: hypothetical protein K6G12_11670 [Lachnospiraceae bacterium]|nr:hypothetical protein [Lachnospiraceae bacterium]